MDFAGFEAIDTLGAANDGRWMVVQKLDGKPLKSALDEEVSLLLAGEDSTIYLVAQRQMTADRVQMAADDEANGHKPSEEELANRAIGYEVKFLTAITMGWKGVLDSKKKPLPPTPEGYAHLYKSYPVIRGQADRFVSRRSNFTVASSGA